MLKVLIIYILIAVISFIAGLNIGLNNPKDLMCPPPEEWKDDGTTHY